MAILLLAALGKLCDVALGLIEKRDPALPQGQVVAEPRRRAQRGQPLPGEAAPPVVQGTGE